ncbi:hypothetical protein ACH5RR_033890 [Cinchona calisaya]|uniref:Uncharacterized protein n=1 Tax=Cinchona calisaya TaxID=153742 RepID=A0ABD2YD37_9GENT
MKKSLAIFVDDGYKDSSQFLYGLMIPFPLNDLLSNNNFDGGEFILWFGKYFEKTLKGYHGNSRRRGGKSIPKEGATSRTPSKGAASQAISLGLQANTLGEGSQPALPKRSGPVSLPWGSHLVCKYAKDLELPYF